MNRKIFLSGIIGMIVGLLIAIQVRSYAEVTEFVARDAEPQDLFLEIYTLKTASESLKEEISSLEAQVEQYSDQTLSYDVIVAEIEKNELLAGIKPISGPGLRITIETPLTLEWTIDLLNEGWAAGAEAISVNGKRASDSSGGFYVINDLLFWGGFRLEAPYTFELIGDATILTANLNQPGGLLARFRSEFSSDAIQLESLEEIWMEAVAE